jgi:hypothetical protein
MGKPYSDLEKRAIAILSGGGDPATSQDQELAKYWKWRLNPSATSHDLPEASIRDTGRKLDDVAIEPFGGVNEKRCGKGEYISVNNTITKLKVGFKITRWFC